MRTTLLQGDCVERMRELAADSIDAVVCDPPYGLEFMGKEWDRLGPSDRARMDGERGYRVGERGGAYERAGVKYVVAGREMQDWHEAWAREALRVLKPGGHLLAFGGTRTYHRLAAAVEDAGFEIRDQIAWMYGSGFPKSLDVSKAIDRAAGAERDVIGNARRPDGTDRPSASTWSSGMGYMGNGADPRQVTAPATVEAARWQGWGTALKPAYEPVVVARKPFPGTVAANVLAYGVGAINVDACRIAFAGADDEASAFPGGATTSHGAGSLAGPGDAQEIDRGGFAAERNSAGRWPANVVLGHSSDCVQVGTDEVEVWECVGDCPVRLLDEQTGERPAGAAGKRTGENEVYGKLGGYDVPWGSYGDTGGASRFFYCSKTSRAERNAGLDEFDKRPILWSSGEQNPGSFQAEGTDRAARNSHPTVKPIELMRWLLRLVVPPGGTILDPFLGSGSTGCAAALEGLDFVGVELDPDYLRIAEARIAFWQEHGEDGLRVVADRAAGERVRAERAATGQLDLLSG